METPCHNPLAELSQVQDQLRSLRARRARFESETESAELAALDDALSQRATQLAKAADFRRQDAEVNAFNEKIAEELVNRISSQLLGLCSDLDALLQAVEGAMGLPLNLDTMHKSQINMIYTAIIDRFARESRALSDKQSHFARVPLLPTLTIVPVRGPRKKAHELHD
jgi:RNAse (barnase) inhibitor barstar